MEVGQRYALIRIRNSKRQLENINGEHVRPSLTLLWSLLRGLSRPWHKNVGQSNVVMKGTWINAERAVAHEVCTQDQEALHNQRQHMTAENQELVQAVDREMEVERTRWSTSFDRREMRFNKQYMREMLCRSRIVKDATLLKNQLNQEFSYRLKKTLNYNLEKGMACRYDV